MRPRATAPRRRQAGLSLVELLIGITVGLFVVAAASTVVANQLSDNRRLLLETQVQQDLRAAMDTITRQLRRAGTGAEANIEAAIAVSPTAGGAGNPFSSIISTTGSASEIEFRFYLDADQQGPFGFKRDGGVILSRMRRTGGLSGTSWQDLTDPNTLTVTSFSVTPRTVTSAVLPCPKLCPVNATLDPAGIRQYCWPQHVVRSFVIEIEAVSRSDASVRRALRNEVRVRNDVVNFNGGATTVCPS